MRRATHAIARLMPALVVGKSLVSSSSPVAVETTAYTWFFACVSTPMTYGYECATTGIELGTFLFYKCGQAAFGRNQPGKRSPRNSTVMSHAHTGGQPSNQVTGWAGQDPAARSSPDKSNGRHPRGQLVNESRRGAERPGPTLPASPRPALVILTAVKGQIPTAPHRGHGCGAAAAGPPPPHRLRRPDGPARKCSRLR